MLGGEDNLKALQNAVEAPGQNAQIALPPMTSITSEIYE